MKFSLAINLPPLPSPPKKTLFIPSIILSVCQFEISTRIRLTSTLVVGCLGIFLAALRKGFPEGIIKPYEGTRLTIGKICQV